MGGNWLHAAILIFFAISWIINQVVTKEVKPGPPLRRPTPPPGGPPTRDPALRFGQPQPTVDPRRPPTRSNAAVSDDIMIIRSESNRSGVRPPQPQARPQARPAAYGRPVAQTNPPAPAKRAGPRARPATAPRRPEPQSTNKSLSSGMPAHALERPTGGLPSMTAVAAAASQASRAVLATTIAPAVSISAAPPLPITLNVTAALSDRDRMRESFILSELLSVPKALKRRRPR